MLIHTKNRIVRTNFKLSSAHGEESQMQTIQEPFQLSLHEIGKRIKSSRRKSGIISIEGGRNLVSRIHARMTTRTSIQRLDGIHFQIKSRIPIEGGEYRWVDIGRWGQIPLGRKIPHLWDRQGGEEHSVVMSGRPDLKE